MIYDEEYEYFNSCTEYQHVHVQCKTRVPNKGNKVLENTQHFCKSY